MTSYRIGHGMVRGYTVTRYDDRGYPVYCAWRATYWGARFLRWRKARRSR